MCNTVRAALAVGALMLPLSWAGSAPAQEKSVNPGINKSYEANPNPQEFTRRFETESREVFANREKIVEACAIKPGMSVADIGAGTGLFTRMFAKEVGEEGKVFAVDIAKNFVDHVVRTARQGGMKNVEGIVATTDDAKLPENSVDLAYICDAYHHFEFPQKTLASIHRALKPGGRIALIDFVRIEGKSSEWTLNHVRAGQEVFEKELESAGFKKVEELKFLKENYFVVFQKQAPTGE